jgi:hypothetical protein
VLGYSYGEVELFEDCAVDEGDAVFEPVPGGSAEGDEVVLRGDEDGLHEEVVLQELRDVHINVLAQILVDIGLHLRSVCLKQQVVGGGCFIGADNGGLAEVELCHGEKLGKAGTLEDVE